MPDSRNNSLMTSKIKRARNAVFTPGREPFAGSTQLQPKHGTVSGPFSFLNPTRAHFAGLDQPGTLRPTRSSSEGHEEEDHAKKGVQDASDAEVLWRSRDNRKGRHPLSVKPATSIDKAKFETPESTSTFKATLKGIGRMFTYYPIWDVSYLVATIFTLGSIVWCINGCFSFLPLIRPSSEFDGEVTIGGGWTAWIGATIFEFGSWLLILEAINENRGGCFGWALEKALDSESSLIKLRPDEGGCQHHHQNRRNLVGASRNRHRHPDKDDKDSNGGHSWRWYPSWHDLKTHYIRELGFLACFAQLCGASIFWIAGFTAIPQLVPGSQGLLDGIYWTPQVIGGTGFIVSGILFLLETQEKWYKPAFGVLGWHIAFWNLIGGIGFTLCGALGYSTSSGAQYQAACSTFWGSWAFLIGSVIQWYESLSKYPVEDNLETSGK